MSEGQEFREMGAGRKEARGERLQRCLAGIFNWMFLILLYCVCAVAYGSLVSDAFLAALLLPLVLWGMKNLASHRFRCLQKTPVRFIWRGMFVFSFLLMLLAAFHLQVDFTWDWGKLIRSASEITLTGELKDQIYFARYPNNQLWLACLAALFRLTKWILPTAGIQEFYYVSMVAGCVFVALTLLLLHALAVRLWGEGKALFVGLSAVLCAPLYLWAMYAYTDTSAMLVGIAAGYLFVRVYQEREHQSAKIFSLCGLGVLAAVAWKLKVTIFILFIAMVLAAALQVRNWKRACALFLAAILCFCGGKILLDHAVSHVISIDQQMYEKYKFPLTHWVMMSMNYGGYVQEDVDYTASFDTYREKIQANLQEWQMRAKEKGFLGCIKHFFYTKLKRTWGDSTFAGSTYVAQKPKNPDGLWQRFCSYPGDMHWVFLLYTGLYYGVLLAFIVLSVPGNLRVSASRQPLLFVRLAILGIAVFLLLWECNSRYLVVYLPFLILLACDGFFQLRRKCLKNAIE